MLRTPKDRPTVWTSRERLDHVAIVVDRQADKLTTTKRERGRSRLWHMKRFHELPLNPLTQIIQYVAHNASRRFMKVRKI
jgi:hypothetical protein